MEFLAFFFLALLSCIYAAPYPDQRITNGFTASKGDYPFIISLEWGIFGLYTHVCGGSIIARNYVITAGHCITEVPGIGSLRALGGEHNLGEESADVQIIYVRSSVVNENYVGGVAPHDLAILHLESYFVYTQYVQPIALPPYGQVAAGDAVISGWGSISTGILPNMPTTLQYAPVPILDYDTCLNAFTALFDEPIPLHITNVCTGPLVGGISACSGDSGGPLSQDGTLLGVVSWGVNPCGTPGAPSVYVSVAHHVDWVLDHVSLDP